MKLFKKLAAVMLVAALALTMVGCGSAADIKSQINDYITDQARVYGEEIVHKDALDKVAEKLLTEANNASKTAEKKNLDAEELLIDEDVVKAAGIKADESYYVSCIENYSFKSELLSSQKVQMLAESLMEDNSTEINSPEEISVDTGFAYGIAVGKIGDKEYIVMLKASLE